MNLSGLKEDSMRSDSCKNLGQGLRPAHKERERDGKEISNRKLRGVYDEEPRTLGVNR